MIMSLQHLNANNQPFSNNKKHLSTMFFIDPSFTITTINITNKAKIIFYNEFGLVFMFSV